ncbi:MAG: energy-coupling factor transporter ATPase [Firmicutes bacterium]|nr:energy-coupling factor transporter ATPase [Bacillota bacterium]
MLGVSKLIEVIGLSHQYRLSNRETVHALEGIDLTIKPGEFVGILGPNGSGKSTLARHFNALLLPTQGKVLVEGLDTSDIKNLWEIRQRVGMVFSNPDNQLIAPIVEEDVAFGPENLGVPPAEIRSRVDQSLERVSMLAYRQRSTSRLSGGQKQRVAIAGALAMLPRCLVLDEPTSMLDHAGRREVLVFLHQLNRELGITMVLITHHLEEIMDADRLIVMEGGRTAMEGTPADLFGSLAEFRHLELDRPPILEMASRLREIGMPVPTGIRTAGEMVDFLAGYADTRVGGRPQ